VGLCPFPEDDVGQLSGALGADHVLFGSDWPHPEGIRQPADYLAALAGQDVLATRKVLRANTARLLGIEAAEVVSSGGGQAPGR
jgi:predicted TIM-barrel fold metal-dependent hydrolase